MFVLQVRVLKQEQDWVTVTQDWVTVTHKGETIRVCVNSGKARGLVRLVWDGPLSFKIERSGRKKS